MAYKEMNGRLLLLLNIAKFIEGSYLVLLVLEFNFSSDLVTQHSKEGIIEGISWIVICDPGAIFE